ncbi:hypothetical protein JCM3765_002644 [Sporobolomyces pararoseus]
MSARLKAEGNVYFANKEWEKAIDLYTQALEAETDLDLKAPLYSNRSTSYVQLDKFEEAIKDAHACVDARPTWSKGYARLGEATARQQLFENAIGAYEGAIELAEDSATKIRYVTALKTLKATKERNQESFSKITPVRASYDFDNSPISRIRRAVEEGFKPKPGGAIELFDFAFGLGSEGYAALEDILWKDHTGHPQGKVGTNTNQSLSECLLLDVEAFCVPPGRDPNFPLLEKLFWLQKLEFYCMGLMNYNDSSKWPPKKIIADWNRRLPREGWGIIRPCCSIMSRGNVINAFLHSKNKSFGAAIQCVQMSIGILEEGNRLWSRVAYEEKGVSFKPTMIRLIKTFLMDIQLEASRDAFSDSTKKVFKIEDVEATARQILAENPHSEWPTDQLDRMRLGYHVIPTCRAYLALAYVSARRGREPLERQIPKGKGVLAVVEHARKAARYYDLAAKFYPDDHDSKPRALLMALEQHLRIGGKKVRDVIRLAEEAERIRVELARFWEDLNSWYPPREFVEQVVKTLSEWLASSQAVAQNGVEPLEQVIKPIPTMAPGTKLTEDYWSKLEGQVRLVHVADKKCRSIHIELA